MEENTNLKIAQIENELFHDESLFKKMLNEAEGTEVDWDRSTLATKKRRIEQLNNELSKLKSKRSRFLIFFF